MRSSLTIILLTTLSRHGFKVSTLLCDENFRLTYVCSPHKFEAPWSAWEFAYHILHKQANLAILSMAWLTRADARSFSVKPKEPDMETLSYWLSRLEPVIRAEDRGEIIVVLANRCGVEGDAVYAGTSCVLGIDAGEVKVYGVLGRGERELLVVDTKKRPQAKLVSEPNSAASTASTAESTRSNESVETAMTIPDAEELHASIDAIISDTALVSPVEPLSPHSYFSTQATKAEDQRDLKSAAGNKPTHTPPMPDSPTFKRPASPKSRNASRTRQQPFQEPPLADHDLINEPALRNLPLMNSPVSVANSIKETIMQEITSQIHEGIPKTVFSPHALTAQNAGRFYEMSSPRGLTAPERPFSVMPRPRSALW
jgi:hypothetical protein